jgi:DNA-binding NarL/FixJ family response regulator
MTGNAPIRVLIADDHPLLREGIAAVLAAFPDMQLVGEAADGREAVEQFRRLRPDVTLMDLQMPHLPGIEAITAIRSEFPAARIVVLTTYRGDVQALRALKAGAAGYLLKSMLRKELADVIRDVHGGRRRMPPEIAHEIAEHAADDSLSAREVEILKRVASGNANKEIAQQLGISEETVKSHMKSMLAKLAAKDRTHAVTIALKRGIIEV